MTHPQTPVLYHQCITRAIADANASSTGALYDAAEILSCYTRGTKKHPDLITNELLNNAN